MTEPEDFLSRWARRKREATAETQTVAKADPGSADQPNRDRSDAPDEAEQDAARRRQTPAQTRDAKPDDAFDLSTLPSLDSIGPTTDIRIFLQPGVPDALSRAALRRAWSADAGIRDFIGLAENSWDFTAGDGMHGFGALDPADAKRLLAELFSEHDSKNDKESESEPPEALPEPLVSSAEARQDDAAEPDSLDDDDALASEPVSVAESDVLLADNAAGVPAASPQEIAAVASQQKTAEPLREPVLVSRSHGRALPQ